MKVHPATQFKRKYEPINIKSPENSSSQPAAMVGRRTGKLFTEDTEEDDKDFYFKESTFNFKSSQKINNNQDKYESNSSDSKDDSDIEDTSSEAESSSVDESSDSDIPSEEIKKINMKFRQTNNTIVEEQGEENLTVEKSSVNDDSKNKDDQERAREQEIKQVFKTRESRLQEKEKKEKEEKEKKEKEEKEKKEKEDREKKERRERERKEKEKKEKEEKERKEKERKEREEKEKREREKKEKEEKERKEKERKEKEEKERRDREKKEREKKEKERKEKEKKNFEKIGISTIKKVKKDEVSVTDENLVKDLGKITNNRFSGRLSLENESLNFDDINMDDESDIKMRKENKTIKEEVEENGSNEDNEKKRLKKGLDEDNSMSSSDVRIKKPTKGKNPFNISLEEQSSPSEQNPKITEKPKHQKKNQQNSQKNKQKEGKRKSQKKFEEEEENSSIYEKEDNQEKKKKEGKIKEQKKKYEETLKDAVFLGDDFQLNDQEPELDTLSPIPVKVEKKKKSEEVKEKKKKSEEVKERKKKVSETQDAQTRRKPRKIGKGTDLDKELYFLKFCSNKNIEVRTFDIVETQPQTFGKNGRYSLRNRIPRLRHDLGERVVYQITKDGPVAKAVKSARIALEKMREDFNAKYDQEKKGKKKKLLKKRDKDQKEKEIKKVEAEHKRMEAELNEDNYNETKEEEIIRISINPKSTKSQSKNYQTEIELKIVEPSDDFSVIIGNKEYINIKRNQTLSVPPNAVYSIKNYSNENLVIEMRILDPEFSD